MELDDKIKQSIEIIQKYETDITYSLAFSGGKDSIVLLDITKKSGVKFNAHYNNTTIDPPGHIKFIKDNFPEIKINQPKYTFYQLVAKKGLPTRKKRFCCDHLKEQVVGGKDKRILTGARKNESIKRSKYNFEDCDKRPWAKGTTYVQPLLLWSENEIWEYIKKNKLPYPKYYDPPYNFKRIGCIGCPLAGKQKFQEFKLFPKYLKAIIKSAKIFNDSRKKTKFNNEYDYVYWWLTEMKINDFIQLRDNGLFKIDFKNRIKETFNI